MKLTRIKSLEDMQSDKYKNCTRVWISRKGLGGEEAVYMKDGKKWRYKNLDSYKIIEGVTPVNLYTSRKVNNEVKKALRNGNYLITID